MGDEYVEWLEVGGFRRNNLEKLVKIQENLVTIVKIVGKFVKNVKILENLVTIVKIVEKFVKIVSEQRLADIWGKS